MRIIAVDDERIALDGLVRAIRKTVPEEEIHGFRSSKEALEFAKFPLVLVLPRVKH